MVCCGTDQNVSSALTAAGDTCGRASLILAIHRELFKDGFGADGKRIYCQINGVTCHQCRQKTLGHHTSCSKCESKRVRFFLCAA